MGKTAIFNWLNHHIRIELSDPDDDNTIYVFIYRQAGTYDPELYNSYLSDYQFSAESDDPNDWVVEGVKSALAQLNSWGVKFHEPTLPPVVTAVESGESSVELDDIPF